MVSINKKNLPQHVAIIMDGNGRWAQSKGLNRLEGHQQGVEVVDEIVMFVRRLGVRYLTLYAFSKENWNRPKEEVEALMALLKSFLLDKKQKMQDNQICLNVIGDTGLLPPDVCDVITAVKSETEAGNQMTLTLALSYGSRDEILRAVKKLIREKTSPSLRPSPQGEGAHRDGEDITEEDFSSYLDTASLPDPDLIIRTSGEYRISNFLLWQGAYAEYFFEDCLWPDFTPKHFMKALDAFQQRERRYGKVSEQLS